MMSRKSKSDKPKIEIATAEEVEKFAHATKAEGADAQASEAPMPDVETPADQAPATDAAESVAQAEQETDLQRAERERDEFKDKWLRAKAESENRARRLLADRDEAVKYAVSDLARSLLTVVDDLERTLEAAEAHDDSASLSEGVRIVYDYVLKVLSDYHIERVEAVGQPFDPQVHEALTQQPSADHPAGIVLQEVQKGYRLHDRVLRPARVIVSAEPTDSDTTTDAEAEDK